MSLNLGNIFADDTFGEFAFNSQDSRGNIFDQNGQHIGVVLGSQADIGTAGAAVSPTSGLQIAQPPAAPTTNVSTGSSMVSTASNWLQKAYFGIRLEDGLFVIVGLLLIAAGLYGFDTVRDTVNTAVEAAAV